MAERLAPPSITVVVSLYSYLAKERQARKHLSTCIFFLVLILWSSLCLFLPSHREINFHSVMTFKSKS